MTTDPTRGPPTGAADVRAMLDDRYGRRPARSRGQRRLARSGAVAAAGVALGLLGWIAWDNATPEVSATLLGYDVRDASTVEVSIEVRRDPARAVRCLLRAQDVNNVTVGRLDLDVPPGGSRTVALAALVPTTRLAINGELEACAAVKGE